MSDHELLNLAAKAAGITLDSDGDRVDVRDNGGAPTAWNPLTDDGDALRLAKTLELILDFRPWAVCIWKGRKQYNSYGGEASLEMHHVRNAIVNAAAEIGRAMS